MKNLILLFLLIPNLVMGGLNQNKTPEPVEGNPFEFLKELVDGLSEGGGYDVEENDSGLSNEVLKPKANQELYPKANQELYEKARVEYLIKMIFPHDIEGAKEIFADPDLKKIDPLYLSQTIRRKMNLVNDKICENNQMDFLPPTLDKIYEAGTQYRFILELGTFNFLFEDYNVSFLEKAEDAIWEDKDIKLKPVLDGEGLLSINLETQIIKSYYTGTLYATIFSTLENNNQCVVRKLDSYWYDSNKVKLIKKTRARNPEDDFRGPNEPYDWVTVSFLDKKDIVLQGELSLHKTIMNSKSKAKTAPLKIYCPSCEEKKEYVINVEIKSYKQKYTERIKKAADRKKKEKERILNETLAPMRKQCEEIGFKRGTKNFKDCVVELM
jgi:hypothetical protein